MTMKYIRYGSQTIDSKDISSVKKSMLSRYLTTGPEVKKFENNFSDYTGSKFALACNSGTAALHMAFYGIGLKKNDNIILPSINFIAAANMCNQIGAKIYFADVDPLTGQMTPETLINCIRNYKIKKIKAFCVMHNGGSPNNFRKFYNLKKRYKCFLVEDCCHSLGGKYSISKKENVGKCKYSDVSTFSFHPVKSITTGEGGMLVTNNKKIYLKSKLLRNHGMIKKNIKGKNNWYYNIIDVGFNYRMNEMQAALGISQLKKLNKFIKKRNFIAKIYNKLFESCKLINLITNKNLDQKSAFHLYIINLNFKNLKISKNNFIQKLHEEKIGVQVHYIPNNYQPIYKRKENFLIGAKQYFENSLSIPIYPNLALDEIEKVGKTIINLINKNKVKKL